MGDAKPAELRPGDLGRSVAHQFPILLRSTASAGKMAKVQLVETDQWSSSVGGQEQETGNWPTSELHVTSLKCLAVGLL